MGISLSHRRYEEIKRMRNSFDCVGQWGIPVIRKQKLPGRDLTALACSQTKKNERDALKRCGVHFFVCRYAKMEIT